MWISDQEHRERHRRGGDFEKLFHVRLYAARVLWIYWIAGLSLVETLFTLAGSKSPFSIVLGVSVVLMKNLKGATMSDLAIQSVNVLLICGLIFCGYYANRLNFRMLLVGFIVLALDTICLFAAFSGPDGLGQRMIALVFRAWALGSLSLAIVQLRAFRSKPQVDS